MPAAQVTVLAGLCIAPWCDANMPHMEGHQPTCGSKQASQATHRSSLGFSVHTETYHNETVWSGALSASSGAHPARPAQMHFTVGQWQMDCIGRQCLRTQAYSMRPGKECGGPCWTQALPHIQEVQHKGVKGLRPLPTRRAGGASCTQTPACRKASWSVDIVIPRMSRLLGGSLMVRWMDMQQWLHMKAHGYAQQVALCATVANLSRPLMASSASR